MYTSNAAKEKLGWEYFFMRRKLKFFFKKPSLFLSFWFFFLNPSLHANEYLNTCGSSQASHVKEFPTRSHIEFEFLSDENLVGQNIYIFSQKDCSYLAAAQIQSEKENHVYVAKIIDKPQYFVFSGDIVVLERNLTAVQKLIPNSELLYSNEIPELKYKPLMYVPGSEFAAPLGKGRFLLDTYGHFSYGLTDHFGVFTEILPDISDLYLFGVKYSFPKTQYFSFSQSITFGYFDFRQVPIIQLTSSLDIPSNGKFINHIIFSNTFVNQTGSYVAFYQSLNVNKTGYSGNIQSANEFIFDNWDRLFFGPTYNFSNGTLGAFVGGIHFFGIAQFYLYLIASDINNINHSSFNSGVFSPFTQGNNISIIPGVSLFF